MDGRGRLGGDGAYPELEETAADIGGGIDRAVAILVRVAHVDHHDGLSRVEPLLELGRRLLEDDLPGLAQHLLQRFHACAPPLRLSL